MAQTNFLKFNVASSSPGVLLGQENFEAVKYQAYRLMDNQDFDGAVAFARLLEGKLGQYQPKGKSEIYYYGILQYWINRLKLFSFSSLNQAESLDLLKKQILAMIKSGLDVRRYLYDFLNFFDTDSIIEDYSKTFVAAVSASQEILGTSANLSGQQNFKSTVVNWLNEYHTTLRTQASGVNIEPGTFNIVKFLDTNIHVKNLTADEKEQLRHLLDFYNWLLSPIGHNEVEKSAKYSNTQKLKLPENISEPEPPKQPARSLPSFASDFKEALIVKKPAAPVQKPVIAPLAKPAQNQAPKGLDLSAKAKVQEAAPPNKAQITPEVSKSPSLGYRSPGPVNIQDLLRSKAQQGPQTGLKIGDAQAAKQQPKTTDQAKGSESKTQAAPAKSLVVDQPLSLKPETKNTSPQAQDIAPTPTAAKNIGGLSLGLSPAQDVKAPAPTQAVADDGARQAEIDKKLEALKKKMGI